MSPKTRMAAYLAFEKLIKCYYKTIPLYLVATVLDPRLKIIYFELL